MRPITWAQQEETRFSLRLVTLASRRGPILSLKSSDLFNVITLKLYKLDQVHTSYDF